MQDGTNPPGKLRMLERPADGKAPRGMLRIPLQGKSDGKGKPGSPTPASKVSSSSPDGGGAGPRFWEVKKMHRSKWSTQQKDYFSKVQAYLKERMPPDMHWARDAGFAAEVDALISECLEICACSSDLAEEECLKKWLYACGSTHYKPADGTAVPLSASYADEFKQLRRKVEQLRIKVTCQEGPLSPTDSATAKEDDDGAAAAAAAAAAVDLKSEGKVINPKHYQRFVCPKEVDPQDIPDTFESLQHWASIVSSNILAEYWACLHSLETSKGGHRAWLGASCEIQSASTLSMHSTSDTDYELAHQLFRFSDDTDAILRLATRSSKRTGVDGAATVHTISFYPPYTKGSSQIGRRKKVLFLAYVGTHLLEYSAVQELAEAQLDAATQRFTGLDDASSQLLASVLDPTTRSTYKAKWGSMGRRSVDSKADEAWKKKLHEYAPPGLKLRDCDTLNASQARVLGRLTDRLEVIHGPPGTGKSTTISYLIRHVLCPTEKVLATCTRNGAVNSIAAKLQGHVPMVVFGAAAAMGDVASQWSLEAQLRRHPGLSRCTQIERSVDTFVKSVGATLARHQLKLKPGNARILLLQYCMARRSPALRLALASYRHLEARTQELQARIGDVRKHLMREIWETARVYLCTVSTSVRLYSDYLQCHADLKDFTVNTVIVDECGSTSEAATAVLLRLKPQKMLLLGDHKQLPAFSLIPTADTNHTQSLMERVIKGFTPSCPDVMLVEQYRMPPDVCKMVSSLFYNGKLVTASCKARSKEKSALPALQWIDSSSKEEKLEGRSIQNSGECEQIKLLLSKLAGSLGGKTVAVLTFYRAQCELLEAELKEFDFVEVVTTDSVQGREFDVVVLSCVRTNKDIGFVKDIPRMCVALSRAQEAVYIFGDPKALCTNQNWKEVFTYSKLTPAERSSRTVASAAGPVRITERECDALPPPDYMMPGMRARMRPHTAEADENCFVFYDPVQAQRGVFVPAAWHQAEALKATSRGNVVCMGSKAASHRSRGGYHQAKQTHHSSRQTIPPSNHVNAPTWSGQPAPQMMPLSPTQHHHQHLAQAGHIPHPQHHPSAQHYGDHGRPNPGQQYYDYTNTLPASAYAGAPVSHHQTPHQHHHQHHGQPQALQHQPHTHHQYPHPYPSHLQHHQPHAWYGTG